MNRKITGQLKVTSPLPPPSSPPPSPSLTSSGGRRREMSFCFVTRCGSSSSRRGPTHITMGCGLGLVIALAMVVMAPSPSSAARVALFPSTGCFSHDVMMRQVGAHFDGDDDQVTWVQTLLYEFGFGPMRLPTDWKRIDISGHDDEGQNLIRETGELLWEQNVPFDLDRPWDMRGIRHFLLMLQRHQKNCVRMMGDARFARLVAETVDVVVLDHFLQECMGGLAHLLNASVVQFSNWPIADGYITSLNIPAMPSAVPKTGTPLSGDGMTFFQRCLNTMFHVCIVFTRFVQMHVLDNLFASRGYPHIRVEDSEAKRIIYAGRSELLFDVVRPINNRIRHFGAGLTEHPREFVIATNGADSTDPLTLKQLRVNITHDVDLIVCPNTTTSSEPTTAPQRRRRWVFAGVDTATIQQRQRSIHANFPALDWGRIDGEKFVLVSFGSVAQVDKMPTRLLQSLLTTFGKSPRLVIWQSNVVGDRLRNLTVPSNVLLVDWLPMKQLLAHPNIEFIVCHGGINTVNELMLFGVPVIGVPLQGDQASNLRRLVELGAGQMISVHDLNRGLLEPAMRRMQANIDTYWTRSEKLSQMLLSQREARGDVQDFWLKWTARNGKKLDGRRLLRLDYVGDVENAFWTAVVVAVAALLIVGST